MSDKKPTRAEAKELNRSHFLWAVLSQLNPDPKEIDFEKIKDDLHIVSMGATAKRWSRLRIEMAMEALKLQVDDSDEDSEDSMAPKTSKTSKSTKRTKPAKRAATIKKSVSTEDEDEDISDAEPVSRPKPKNHTKPKAKTPVSTTKKSKKTIVKEDSEISGSGAEDVVAKKASKSQPAATMIEEEYKQMAQEVYDPQDSDDHENNEPKDPLPKHAGPMGQSAETEEHSDDGDERI
jgi:hypothetical protein